MHMHTLPTSACSKISAKDTVRELYENGYSGGVITNHFKHGNTGINRKLKWADFVKPYEEDYLLLKEEAMMLGLDIMFGVEEGVGGGKEILCYGITPQVLYDHPELEACDASLWYKVVHEEGGLVIQAHPFRTRDYISARGAMDKSLIDGIEVFNYFNTLSDNMEAEEFARQNPDLILIAGGDSHGYGAMAKSGIETAAPITNEKALVDVLRRGAFNRLTE